MAELTTPVGDMPTSSACCSTQAQAACCEPSEKSSCCGDAAAGGSCGCSAGQDAGTTASATGSEDIRETVREKYASAARAVAQQSTSASCCGPIALTDADDIQVFRTDGSRCSRRVPE
jgi:arsenite methyltransferase